MALPNLLTLDRCADLLHCRRRTAGEWVRWGELPGFKVSGRLLVTEQALTAWLETRRVQSATRTPKCGRSASTLADGDVKRRLRTWTSPGTKPTRQAAPGSTIGRR